MTDSLGWYHKKQENQYIHPAGMVLITPKGKINQYFYGTFFLPMHFKMAIMDAWKEQISVTRIKSQKYCSNHVTRSNHYIEKLIGYFGFLIIFAAIIFLAYLILPNILNTSGKKQSSKT